MNPTRLAALVALALLAPLAPAQDLPSPSEFHRHVRAVLETYPTDGTHAYHWPKGSSWAGNTRDLRYLGELFAAGDAQGRAYCCGLTFEVFFRAWERWAAQERREFRIGDLDSAALKSFRSRWFCAGDSRRGPLDALEPAGLGFAVEARDARAGDFVQLWRNNGSGHSVIFLGWTTSGGRRTGIRYWSTQTLTHGVGVATETFEGERGVDPERLHLARVGRR